MSTLRLVCYWVVDYTVKTIGLILGLGCLSCIMWPRNANRFSWNFIEVLLLPLLYQKTYLTAFQASLPQPSNRCVRSKQQTQNLTRNADWYINWINKNKHNSDLNPMHFLNFMCHAHTRFATEAIKVTETFLQCMW